LPIHSFSSVPGAIAIWSGLVLMTAWKLIQSASPAM